MLFFDTKVKIRVGPRKAKRIFTLSEDGRYFEGLSRKS